MPHGERGDRVSQKLLAFLREDERFAKAYRACNKNLTATAKFLKVNRRSLADAFDADETGELAAQREEIDCEDHDQVMTTLRSMARGEAKATSAQVGACMAWLKSFAGVSDRQVVEHRGRVEYVPPEEAKRLGMLTDADSKLGAGIDQASDPLGQVAPQDAIFKVVSGGGNSG